MDALVTVHVSVTSRGFKFTAGECVFQVVSYKQTLQQKVLVPVLYLPRGVRSLDHRILYYFDQMFTDFGFFARRDGR
jgi:hypothetical protein